MVNLTNNRLPLEESLFNLKKQINTIQNSPALRCLGAAMSLCGSYTAVIWAQTDKAQFFEANNPNSICWPFWQNCLDYKFFTTQQTYYFLLSFLFISLFSATLFCFKKQTPLALLTLTLCHLFKIYGSLQDFHMMGNYYYMEYWLFAVYLFVPSPLPTIRFLFVGFYFFAGLLKLNGEWISGSAIPNLGHGPDSLTQWFKDTSLIYLLCTYVVILETTFVIGLLSYRKKWFFFAFSQLIVFHLYSIDIVGWFYPTTMFSLITFLLFDFYDKQKEANPPLIRQQAQSLNRTGKTVLILFVILQLTPRLIPGDPALTGEASLFRLNMLDSLTECEARMTAHYPDHTVEIKMSKFDFQEIVRIWCHPYGYFFRVKQRCQELSINPQFSGIEFMLLSRRSNEKDWTQKIHLENACSPEITYNLLYNSWIHSPSN